MRYVDDILLFVSLSNRWDHEEILFYFRNECYWKPLTLTQPELQDTFIETKFVVENQQIHSRLKNDNEWKKNVWRYHHYDSHLSYEMKRATLHSTLGKVDLHASDSKQLQLSAMAKANEFLRLGYPAGILRHMCSTLALETRRTTWYHIRKLIR